MCMNRNKCNLTKMLIEAAPLNYWKERDNIIALNQPGTYVKISCNGRLVLGEILMENKKSYYLRNTRGSYSKNQFYKKSRKLLKYVEVYFFSSCY